MPIGYRESRLEIGGRIHAGKDIAQRGQMPVDEFRISNTVRDGSIQNPHRSRPTTTLSCRCTFIPHIRSLTSPARKQNNQGTIMKETLLCLAVGAIAAAAFAAEPLTLVKDGAPASIVIAAERPSRAAQFAAFEIQHHVKLITGSILPIVNDQAPVVGVKILVGDSLATRAMGINRESFKGENYMVKCTPEAIVLIGNDTFDGRVVNYQDLKTFPVSRSYAPLDNATLWASYDFLENGCDIRHYAPTDAGITFIPRSSLSVEMSDICRQPAMDAFRVFYAPEMYFERGKHFEKRDVELFKLRWRNTERFAMTNHNTSSIYYKYYRRAVNSP